MMAAFLHGHTDCKSTKGWSKRSKTIWKNFPFCPLQVQRYIPTKKAQNLKSANYIKYDNLIANVKHIPVWW